MGVFPARAALVLSAIALLAACGRRGEPRPPAGPRPPAPPRIEVLVRAGDQVRLRMDEATGTTWQAEFGPAGEACPDPSAPFLPGPVLSPAPDGWTSTAIPDTTTTRVRIGETGGGRLSRWYEVAPGPAPAPLDDVRLQVAGDGRLRLDLPAPMVFLLEQRSPGEAWTYYGEQETASLGLGPFPPGAVREIRLWPARREGATLLVQPRPWEAAATIP